MSKNPNNLTYIHRIDPNDMIVNVNDDWLSFGSENVYPVSQDSVVNKSLWDFIANMETQELYRAMIEKVRDDNREIKVPFRCDSPDCRRFMELEIVPLSEDFIEFRSRIVKLECRSSVSLLDVDVERSDEFVRICSWCKKVYISDSKWVEVEEAIEQLDLFGATTLPQLTHGICPSCTDDISQMLSSDSTFSG